MKICVWNWICTCSFMESQLWHYMKLTGRFHVPFTLHRSDPSLFASLRRMGGSQIESGSHGGEETKFIDLPAVKFLPLSHSASNPIINELLYKLRAQRRKYLVRFEVFSAMWLKLEVSWCVPVCRLANCHHRFGGTCLTLQAGGWSQQASPNLRQIFTIRKQIVWYWILSFIHTSEVDQNFGIFTLIAGMD